MSLTFTIGGVDTAENEPPRETKEKEEEEADEEADEEA